MELRTGLLFLALSLHLFVSCAWQDDDSLPRRLITLSDENFEHDTQASTGQTTGIWLVLFVDRSCPECQVVEDNLLAVAAHLEGQAIVAKLDISGSPKTGQRFGITKGPVLKLFRNRGMVTYAGQLSLDEILSFMKDGWKNGVLEAVPKEPTAVLASLDYVRALYAKFIEFLARNPLTLALVVSIVAMLCYVATSNLLGMGTTKGGKRKRQSQMRSKRAD